MQSQNQADVSREDGHRRAGHRPRRRGLHNWRRREHHDCISLRSAGATLVTRAAAQDGQIGALDAPHQLPGAGAVQQFDETD